MVCSTIIYCWAFDIQEIRVHIIIFMLCKHKLPMMMLGFLINCRILKLYIANTK